jgi:hypothetical protein
MSESISSDVTGEDLTPDLSTVPKSIGANWSSDDCGQVNGLATGPALVPGSGYLAINDNSDLSSCVVGNFRGRVYTIYNAREATGIYHYVIWVLAEGPHGAGSGNIWLTFGDESGDHYRLKIHDSTKKWHYIRYNSDKPSLDSLNWNDEKP